MTEATLDFGSWESEEKNLSNVVGDIQNDICEDFDEAIGTIVIAEVSINTWTNPETGDKGENNKIAKFQQQS